MTRTPRILHILHISHGSPTKNLEIQHTLSVVSSQKGPPSPPIWYPSFTREPPTILPRSQVGSEGRDFQTGLSALSVLRTDSFSTTPRLFSSLTPSFLVLHPAAHTSLILPCLQYPYCPCRLALVDLVAHITSPNSYFSGPDHPRKS
jgi:hypothetical protein